MKKKPIIYLSCDLLASAKLLNMQNIKFQYRLENKANFFLYKQIFIFILIFKN
jgi:hypothetical protein